LARKSRGKLKRWILTKGTFKALTLSELLLIPWSLIRSKELFAAVSSSSQNEEMKN
jgi:hypothetical protein